MKKPRSILVLLLLLVFGMFLAVPAEDVPETAYDESEGLPYEVTPLFSIVGPQAWARIAKAELSCGSPRRFNLTKRCKRILKTTGGRTGSPISSPSSIILFAVRTPQLGRISSPCPEFWSGMGLAVRRPDLKQLKRENRITLHNRAPLS